MGPRCSRDFAQKKHKRARVKGREIELGSWEKVGIEREIGTLTWPECNKVLTLGAQGGCVRPVPGTVFGCFTEWTRFLGGVRAPFLHTNCTGV